MQLATPPSKSSSNSNVRVRTRTALLASSDRNFRQRMNAVLSGLRWHVREAETGAQAWAEAQSAAPETVIVDTWLPDLELSEFLRDFRVAFPGVDLVTSEGTPLHEAPRSPYRQEILYALRSTEGADTVAWNAAPAFAVDPAVTAKTASVLRPSVDGPRTLRSVAKPENCTLSQAEMTPVQMGSAPRGLPELVGEADCMLDISRRIRLVAPRSTPVLIEGPTGSGKELVAQALHRLSSRSRKPFLALNCAAIPEALLEAELFGHTRGAFTGAVHGRTGRIEAADGGTLFLDEIGEMPLALQAKLLRFVECGELQRVGENEPVTVDVRIIAATHRDLAQRSEEGTFRKDLYYRLAVFFIQTPALSAHIDDLPLLVEHFLQRMGRTEPLKRVDVGAMEKLCQHPWPGNVRELEHVLERAAILAGDSPLIRADEIDFGPRVN